MTNEKILEQTSPFMDHSENFNLIMDIFRECISKSDFPAIEIGTNEGGSALAFLSILKEEKKKNWLYTIDPYGCLLYSDGIQAREEISIYSNDRYRRAISRLSKFAETYELNHYHFKCRSSEFKSYIYDNFTVYEEGNERKLGKFSFVFLDGSHDINQVCEEVEFFSNKLSEEGQMIVDDVVPGRKTTLIGNMSSEWHKKFTILDLGGHSRLQIKLKREA